MANKIKDFFIFKDLRWTICALLKFIPKCLYTNPIADNRKEIILLLKHYDLSKSGKIQL